jgi:hypothetical protein
MHNKDSRHTLKKEVFVRSGAVTRRQDILHKSISLVAAISNIQ